MKNFMDENFLLQTETAQKLYHEHAAKMPRSEEHTSELQSRPHLVCRLLLEKKNKHNSPTSQRLQIISTHTRNTY